MGKRIMLDEAAGINQPFIAANASIKTKMPITPSEQPVLSEEDKQVVTKLLTSEKTKTTPQYTVVSGDNLWRIAKRQGLSLDTLRSMNPQIKGNLIRPGDKLNLDYKPIEYETKKVNLKQEEANEAVWNQNNIDAIQHANHDSNYAIVDKKNRTLSVYDKNNNLLYQTKDISTGRDGGDYNTITYAGRGFQNYAGNNSTPAGMLAISGISNYHGAPAFQRSRYNTKTGKWSEDEVASSMHVGNTSNARSSNGCIRVGKTSLEKMSSYLGVGDMVYTLPENEGSRFVLKNGKLNYVADNPYGNTKKGHISKSGHDMVYWDDYNVHVDKSYSPLSIKLNKSTYSDDDIIHKSKHDTNAQDYADALSANKESLQKKFNLTSYEYNKLAQLAMGIGEQETKFGTSTKYALKLLVGDEGVTKLKALQALIGKDPDPVNSKGLTQIKYAADMANKDIYNPETGKLIQKGLSSYYKELGVTEQSLETAQGAAIGTLARLAYMYNTEVKGRKFTGPNNESINPYDALLYKYNGHNDRLRYHTATPDKNLYVKNVKQYSDNFDYFEERKYRK